VDLYDVYQMAFVANADHSGAFASLIPCAQGLGQIVGPNVAASMLGHSLGYGNVFLMCALFALSGALTYLAVSLKLRRIIPALGDNNDLCCHPKRVLLMSLGNRMTTVSVHWCYSSG
jgi:MFS family permease